MLLTGIRYTWERRPILHSPSQILVINCTFNCSSICFCWDTSLCPSSSGIMSEIETLLENLSPKQEAILQEVSGPIYYDNLSFLSITISVYIRTCLVYESVKRMPQLTGQRCSKLAVDCWCGSPDLYFWPGVIMSALLVWQYNFSAVDRLTSNTVCQIKWDLCRVNVSHLIQHVFGPCQTVFF